MCQAADSKSTKLEDLYCTQKVILQTATKSLQILTAKLQKSISISSPPAVPSIAVKASHLGGAWHALAVLQEEASALSWLSSELLAKLFIPLLGSEQAPTITSHSTEEDLRELRLLTAAEGIQAENEGKESAMMQCLDFVQGKTNNNKVTGFC